MASSASSRKSFESVQKKKNNVRARRGASWQAKASTFFSGNEIKIIFSEIKYLEKQRCFGYSRHFDRNIAKGIQGL